MQGDPYSHTMYRAQCIGEAQAQAQADMEEAMPPVKLTPTQNDLSANPSATSIDKPQDDNPAETNCVGQWGSGDDYFYLNYTAKEVHFVQPDGGNFVAPYEESEGQIIFIANDGESRIVCDGNLATVTNDASGQSRAYEAIRN